MPPPHPIPVCRTARLRATSLHYGRKEEKMSFSIIKISIGKRIVKLWHPHQMHTAYHNQRHLNCTCLHCFLKAPSPLQCSHTLKSLTEYTFSQLSVVEADWSVWSCDWTSHSNSSTLPTWRIQSVSDAMAALGLRHLCTHGVPRHSFITTPIFYVNAGKQEFLNSLLLHMHQDRRACNECHCAQVGVSPTDAVVAAEIRVKNFDCHFLLLHCLITLQIKMFTI